MIEHSHSTSIRVRYADTDKMGIVYNGNYLTYFEIGRTELLRALGLPYAELEKQGIQLPVMEAHIEYKSPAYYDDMLTVKAVCTMERGILLKICYEICRDVQLLTIGHTIHPFMNSTTQKPTRPPMEFMNIWNEFKSTSSQKEGIQA
jgi:acyl-CoA thioester hydrolase